MHTAVQPNGAPKSNGKNVCKLSIQFLLSSMRRHIRPVNTIIVRKGSASCCEEYRNSPQGSQEAAFERVRMVANSMKIRIKSESDCSLSLTPIK